MESNLYQSEEMMLLLLLEDQIKVLQEKLRMSIEKSGVYMLRKSKELLRKELWFKFQSILQMLRLLS